MNKKIDNYLYSRDLGVLLTLVVLGISLFVFTVLVHAISDVFLCDSGSIQDFVVNQEDSVYINRAPNSSIFNTVKRKLAWHLTEKKSSRFSDYNHFKSKWNPSTKLWDILKADLKASRLSASKGKETSYQASSSIMNDVRNSRTYNTNLITGVRRRFGK